ncbi:MAG: glutamine-hydrolyzing GMP synthase [Pyrinomonadaceae bacterium]
MPGEKGEVFLTTHSIAKYDTIVILDFGSQYTQLIARRIRELNVYCQIYPYNAPISHVLELNPTGLILSGGPSSVYDLGAPRLTNNLLEQVKCPVLGICYGFQLLTVELGGEVNPSQNKEYGYARLTITEQSSPLFKGLPNEIDAWLSHGDYVTTLPAGFRSTARTANALNAFENLNRGLFGVQFHPEVAHTPLGIEILRNFVLNICGAHADWTPSSIIEREVNAIRSRVQNKSVICALSGGVDSTVAASLVHRAIGKKQSCVFVDTGLMREGEFESIINLFKQFTDLNVHGVRAGERFLSALAGVTDPEQKRRIIGQVFIEVFENEAAHFGDPEYLVQGTLYPDVIESNSAHGGPSAVIKSHHNVGGLPSDLRFKLIEPLRELFKDEVRTIGRSLNIPEEILKRHPFPGPGLAVRIIGEITEFNLQVLRAADVLVEEELRSADLYDSVWQAFPVLLPVSSVGVMGDFRTYEKVIAIRVVNSSDGMTADWTRLPYDVLARISGRIVAEIRGVNRVVYDITSKPPGTIEWE